MFLNRYSGGFSLWGPQSAVLIACLMLWLHQWITTHGIQDNSWGSNKLSSLYIHTVSLKSDHRFHHGKVITIDISYNGSAWISN